MTRQPVRAALVGVGAWARVLANAASTSSRIDLTGCVGRTPEKLDAFARETGIPAFPDYQSVLADQEVDAVILAVPNDLHFPMAEAAARAGKHVYIEKPIATTLRDGFKIVQLERNYGVRIVVGHCARFLNGNRQIRRAIDAGELGRVNQIEANFSNGRALRLTSNDWRWYQASAPGGSLSQIAIHQFDTLRFLGGDIASVSAIAARNSSLGAEVEDQWIIGVVFADGKLGTVISNWVSPGIHCVRVTGDKALMSYEVDESAWSRPSHLHKNAILYKQLQGKGVEDRQQIPVAESNMYRDELELFADYINGADCELSAENGYRALSAVYAALSSAANNGRSVSIGETMARQQ